MTPTFQDKVASYIEVADAAITKAEAAIAGYRGRDKKAADRIAAAVETLVTTGVAKPGNKEKWAVALSDHAATIDLLVKMAEQKAAAANVPGALGHSVDGNGQQTKAASHQNSDAALNSMIIGVRDGKIKQSDIVFLKGLGLPVPN